MARILSGKAGVRKGRPPIPSLPPDLGRRLNTNEARAKSIEVAQFMRDRAVAIGQLMLERNVNEVFDLQGTVYNPVATVPVTGNAVVEFTVPRGQVLMVNKIGISYSDPFIGQVISLGWWLTVGDRRVPYVDQTTPGLDYFYFSHHQLVGSTDINPLWIQAGETVAIQVYPDNGFDEQVTVMATLNGQLYKIGAPVGVAT